MTKERFRISDFRFITVCAVLLAATVWFTARNFYRAFPEASIAFRVSRGEALTIAERFLAARGASTATFRNASSFTFDDDAKTFLEREAGLERANRIMGARVRLWRWSYRWFRPGQKEEYRVDVTPSGEVAGFEHLLPEDAVAGDLTVDQAREVAEDLLRTVSGKDPASLDFVESSEATRPHRVDRTFVWKQRDFDLGGSSIRHEVTVLGSRAGSYREYLKVPEQWTRDYQRLRSRNEIAQTVDTALVALLGVGLIAAIVMRLRRQDVRWRRAAMVGMIGMALTFLAGINELPLQEFAYPTTDSYQSFIASRLLQAVLGALAAGGFLFVLAAGAEPVYREALPGQISLGNLFGVRGIGTRRFLLGTVLGLTLTGFFLAYQTAFYIVAARLGAWSPADVPSSDLLNTRFPWLFVLLGGYLPAVSEELLFRMFAIPFLRKLVRSLPVALLLAGFLWGFGHAGYAQQPFFIRGLEVGIAGVILGAIVMRWGILPALVWHYSVDAMYSALLMLRSESLYFRLSGAAAAGITVVPVVVAVVLYVRRGGFEPETGLLNADDAAPDSEVLPSPEPAAQTARFEYRPLGLPMRILAGAVFVGGLLAWQIPVAKHTGDPAFRLDAAQARASADAFLRSQGVDPAAFRSIAVPAAHWEDPDRLAAKYFLERRTPEAALDLFAQYRPLHYWRVRYFQSLDPEGWELAVHPATGKVLGFVHVLPEARPGASLAPEQAQRIAAAFALSRGLDVTKLDLKESTSENRPARRDYTLIWEARPGDPRNVEETRYRVEAEVSGDRVTALGSYWKVPEAFERSRRQTNWVSISAVALRVLLMTAAAIFGVLFLGRAIRQGLVRWRTAIRLGIAGALVAAIEPLLSSGRWLQNYNSAVPLATFQGLLVASLVLLVLAGFLMYGAAGALLSAWFPEAFETFRVQRRRALGRDAAAALLFAAGAGILWSRIGTLVADRFHGQLMWDVTAPALLGSSMPAVSALGAAVSTWIAGAGVLALAACIVRFVGRPRLMVPLVLAAACLGVTARVRTPGEFALEYFLTLVPLAAVLWFMARFARRNYLAYALVLWLAALRPHLAELLSADNGTLRLHGWIVAAVFTATALWALAPAVKDPDPQDYRD